MRIFVAGTRERSATRDEAVVFGKIWRLLDGTVLGHGCCPATGTPKTDGVPGRMRGVDGWAEARARARGIPVEHFPPKQVSIGWPGCGPERSRRGVLWSQAVVLFPGGKGTARTRGFALELGRPLYEIFTVDGVTDWTGPCATCGAPSDGFGCGCCNPSEGTACRRFP